MNVKDTEYERLRKTVHEYGNLIQRLYMMVVPMGDDRRDDEVLNDVYEELDGFIKNQSRA